jgi:hypothetical protein
VGFFKAVEYSRPSRGANGPSASPPTNVSMLQSRILLASSVCMPAQARGLCLCGRRASNAPCARLGEALLETREIIGLDGGADVAHQVLVIVQIVNRHEARPEHFLRTIQVM